MHFNRFMYICNVFLDLYYQSVNSLSWEFDLILFFINLKVFLLYTMYLELTSTERSLNISMSANTPLYICYFFSLWRGMADYEQGHPISLLISPHFGGSPCTLLVFRETEPRILVVVVITLNALVTFI